ncbi:pilus assembly protein PilO [Cronbergia sp. UHCC 0137]|uniref:pilus assembly protein PilO n=1 Tax=Cronbergia sp. UHCC 0137 TaxID=3110239 RepID=UPI002B2037C5|nr:pilus assembly protein PilO [Cronbergia sp. UHCC 0137]MEA5618914.1 pilus assembly protein PilO [Cronbergia sp. UHCC 0137]
MTLSDDLNFGEQGSDFDDGPAYPVAFGITFTPLIIGVGVGVTGVLAAIYLLLNIVMPAWDNYQQQQTKSNELQGQVNEKKVQSQQIDKVKTDLAQAKKQQVQILALFANEKSLDTLLLDTSRLVDSGNSRIPPNAVQARLVRFTPTSEQPEVITDGSFGVEVNNMLQRSLININIEGTFEQTQAIMRNIERLQPLLIVKDYQSTLAPLEATTTADNKKVVRGGPKALITSFQLQALMPTSLEVAAPVTPAEEKK